MENFIHILMCYNKTRIYIDKLLDIYEWFF